MLKKPAIKSTRYSWILIGALIGLSGILGFGIHQTTADQIPGGRSRTIEVQQKQFIWDIISNANGNQLCELSIEFDRKPSNDEILAACADLFQASMLPTTAPGAKPVPTPMVFDRATFLNYTHAHLKEIHDFKRTVKIPLQDLIVNLVIPDQLTSEPYAIVAAFEPETDYKITAIHIKLDSGDYKCNYSRCRILILRDTSMEFWADSSFGDEAQHTKATIRVSQKDGKYQLSIESISPVQLFSDSCSQIWGTSVGAPAPVWEVFPTSPENLHTNKKYYYLAGKLIKNQVVNTTACPGQGLLSDGSPNACGMEAVKDEVVRWQNQYDTMIWSTARSTGIPPILIKGLIELESQFWPSNVRYFMFEFGLAQINQYGADVALRWDNDLYKQVCNGLFYDCSVAYASLPPSMQAIVRGGLVRSINSECPTCQYGIDYARTAQSIPTIARILRSNCRQTNYILNQQTVKPTYENAWKFTLLSYHSGYSCLDDAIRKTVANVETVSWTNVAKNISPDCPGAADYVNSLWENLESFPANQIKPDLTGVDIPLTSQEPTAMPTPTATPYTAHSTIQVLVYIDTNKNGTADDGEGVDNLTVNLVFENGTTQSKKTTAGMVLFDMSGILVDTNVKILLPTQLLSKSLLVPADGTILVPFQLQQSVLPPILP